MTTQIRPLEEESRNTLFDMAQGIYLDGECYAFAIAMHRGLGWPMVGLMTDQPGSFAPRHVAVHSSITHQLHDVRGPFEQDSPTFGEPFGCKPVYTLQLVDEERLQNVRPVPENTIEQAREYAEKLWPQYPWMESQLMQAKAFVDELEKLSRKYGFWIRAPYPAQKPVLCKAFGQETGYSLEHGLIGESFLVDRSLE